MNGQILAFVGVAAGVIVMPGADFAVVMRNALHHRALGLATAVGVVGGLVFHTTLAACGLASLLTTSPVAYAALRWVGAGYLLYLGGRILAELRSPSVPERPGAGDDVPEPPAVTGRGGAVITARQEVRAGPVRVSQGAWQGFLTNATNPKAPMLFLSLLPQFVPPGSAVVPRTLLLCVIIVLLGMLWFPLVALAVDHAGALLRRPAAARAISLLTGAALLTLAVLIVVHA